MNGFILLHRNILNWGHYKNLTAKDAFFHLLFMANFTESENFGHTILRGQVFTSLSALSNEIEIAHKSAKRALTVLEASGEIKSKRINDKLLITILNYDETQSISGANSFEKQKNRKRRRPNKKCSAKR